MFGVCAGDFRNVIFRLISFCVLLGFIQLAVNVPMIDHFSVDGSSAADRKYPTEFQRYDGWYNNIAHPEWGSVDSHIVRKAPTSYVDGVYQLSPSTQQPNARTLSRKFMRGGDGIPSSRNRTTMLAFFGEFLAFDLLQGTEHGCPIELLQIPIETCDPNFDPDCQGSKAMPVLRTKYDQKTGQSPSSPRAQMNLMTSWIDGSAVYSTKEIWTMSMRSFEEGLFNVGENGMPPRNKIGAPIGNPAPSKLNQFLDPRRLYLLGDPRSNQHPPILTLNILFYRFHNVMAKRVKREHPSWSDEDIFQQARRWVIAIIQNIALYEYLPAFLDVPIEPYSGYQADVHPGISDVFQAAAFRFGHTQVPAGLYVRDAKCNFQPTADGFPAHRLCNMWFDSQVMLDEVGGIEPILMGLASQIAEREDAIIIDDLRDHIFGPIEFSRRDLAAVNIMRGRDYGLPDYNTARRAFKLAAIADFTDINKDLSKSDPEMFDNLNQLYGGKLDDIDIYIGGMLECDGTKPGPLFSQIIKEQFLRLRDADRFWFENRENGIFTQEEIWSIRNFTLYDVIVASTDIPAEAIQKHVFFWHNGDPCQQPRQIKGEMLKPCVILGGVNTDVFSGNEVPFIYTCVLITFIPILAWLSAYLLIKYRHRQRRKHLQYHQDHILPSVYGETVVHEKLIALEWLHQNQKRLVKIKFSTGGKIQVENRKGDRLRTIQTKNVQVMLLEITTESTLDPMALLRIHKEPDLVLIFEDITLRTKFIAKLSQFLKAEEKELVLTPTSHEHIYNTAETKEKRQQRLEKFFKIAYARAFGMDKSQRTPEELQDCEEAMQLKLTKADFAEALAMKPSCAFIQKMFNCIDKAGEGKISFQQFLDLIVHFAHGDSRGRLKVFFDMCDTDGSGLIQHAQLFDLIRYTNKNIPKSLLDMTASQKGATGIDAVTWKIFETYGLQDKKKLSFDDFLILFLDHQHEMQHVGLDFKGVHQNFSSKSDSAYNSTAKRQSFIDDISDLEIPCSGIPGLVQRKWNHLMAFLEENKQQIFYLVVFCFVVAGAWLERFSFYMFLNETNDLRKVMGAGIAVTRGSAAAMSVAFSALLLAVCRNVITQLRETFVGKYIPLDSNLQFHKIAAWTGGFFAVIHTAGHLINFYHVSTQPVDHLKCLFKEATFEDTPPPFASWIYKSLTGLTGVLLVVIICVMYVFARQSVRDHAYRYFWLTHRFGAVAFYILTITHGLPRLTGEPHFQWYFMGPLIIFVIDRLIGIKQTVLELEVIESELLPSEVVHLKFMRPPSFNFRSGQWIRLMCTAFSPQEAHPFTLTSMPHDNFLSVHVKAQGIWTWKLQNAFDHNLEQPATRPTPKLRIEGPFGGGNQDWYKYEVAVMVGAGMGVTPYASILKDLVFGTSTNRHSGFKCKKVYFMWVTPSHKPFEWFVDALHEIEKRDVTRVLEIHIFVTQFFHKFDLRTTMLYVCESHFQRLSKKSLFTGLKAVNHFGRPDIPGFLEFVKAKHPQTSSVGVFSCGPKPFTKNVGLSCEIVNRQREFPRFLHHYENF